MASTGNSDMTSLPNHVYFRACVGAWRSPIAMTVGDPAASKRAGMGWLDRWSLRLMAAWPRWLGRFYLHTTVTCDDEGEVVHTTVARWLGLPVHWSTETMRLDPDGRRFTVEGGMTGSGTIDETATRAEYDLSWLGVRIRQHTVREPDVVTVTQEGPGFAATQRLLRQR